MDFLELAAKRRSLRKFSDREVTRETIDKILEATFTAPSSKNLRTTRIAVSVNRETMASIAKMRSMGSAFVDQAPVAFFVMGDDSQTDLWRENASISATVLQFAAESLGLGSCWVQVFGRPHDEADPAGETAEEYLRRSVPGLPAHKIMCVVAAGYPEGERAPRKEWDYGDNITYL